MNGQLFRGHGDPKHRSSKEKAVSNEVMKHVLDRFCEETLLTCDVSERSSHDWHQYSDFTPQDRDR